MVKNNYCLSCKFQFRDRASFLLHIQQTHANEQSKFQKQEDLGRAPEVKIMRDEDRLAWYLDHASSVRERYFLEKDPDTKIVYVKDKQKYEALNPYLRQLVDSAMMIVNFKRG